MEKGTCNRKLQKFIILRVTEVIFFIEKFENITIEERVSLLEIEMEEVQGEVVEVQDEVIILFSQQVIQDDRLGNLEEDTDQLEINVEGKNVSLSIFKQLKQAVLQQSSAEIRFYVTYPHLKGKVTL